MRFRVIQPDSLLKWTFWTALITGLLLTTYISCTVFIPFNYSSWLLYHNTLFIISIAGAFWVGHNYRVSKKSFRLFLIALILYFGIIFILYIGSYALITTFFAGSMKWIPFDYRDYEYHAFRSVGDYLNHSTNFKELLILQIFSFVLCFILYLAAGLLGFCFLFPRFGKRQLKDG